MTITDETAHRLAWTTFLTLCGMYLFAIVLGISTGTMGPGGDLFFALMLLLFPLVGILILRQQPKNRIGWIVLGGIGVLWGLNAVLDGIGQWGMAERAGTVPGWQVAEALSGGLWAPALGLMGTFLILLFPDGHLPSRKWRPVAWLSAFSITLIYLGVTLSPGRLDIPGHKVINPLGIDALDPVAGFFLPIVMLLPLCFVLCAVALILRFRRARGVERQQLKWLATAAMVVALVYLAAMAVSTGGAWGGREPAWLTGLQNVAVTSFGLIPIAIGFAVLKYNLYEIDVVINKTVVVGALAVFITGVYVGIVVGLGAALPHVFRKDNLALSLIATAVVAVAFQPVRTRVQRYANRLVYGSRATPYEVLSDFASRMKGAYDSAELLPHMARTVAEGMGASQAEVWLKVGGSLTREAVWPPADEVAPVPTPDGTLPALPADQVAAVRQEGELLGAITVTKPPTDPLTPAEEKLLDDVAAQAALVLRNARLIEDLRSSRQRLVSAQDEERRRLERNLHDGAQQSLVAVALTLRMTTGQLEATAPDAVRPLEQASQQLSEAIEELRELARGIHPAILTERGLGPAVNSLAERSPVPVVVTDRLDGRLPATIEATAYFVVAEALTNAAKYAAADQVTVSLEVGSAPSVLTVVVADDGRGGVDLSHGTGLRGLADRVSVADGNLKVDSRAGQGTRVTCRLPVPRQIPLQPRVQPTGTEPDVTTVVGAGR